MSLNKKQKKQIEVEKKKIAQLHLQLNGAKEQMDDPNEVTNLQKQIKECEARMKKIQESDA